jgi:hypothetical protein
MLNNKQKAQTLLSILGDTSAKVLSKLQPHNSNLLTTAIEDAPTQNPQELSSLLFEILEKIDDYKNFEPSTITSIDDINSNLSETSTEPDTPKEASDEEALIEETEETTQKASENDIQENINPADIADLLSRQKPQIIAFFLANIQDEFRNQIVEHLSEDVRSSIESIEIASIPISDNVFKNLYKTIISSATPKADGDEPLLKQETLSSFDNEPSTIQEIEQPNYEEAVDNNIAEETEIPPTIPETPIDFTTNDRLTAVNDDKIQDLIIEPYEEPVEPNEIIPDESFDTKINTPTIESSSEDKIFSSDKDLNDDISFDDDSNDEDDDSDLFKDDEFMNF